MNLSYAHSVRLRPWLATDTDALVRHGNNARVWQQLTDAFPHPYTDEAAHGWVQFATQPSDSLFFAIDLNGEAIGGLGVEAQTGPHAHAGVLGYWLGEQHWGKGLATQAVQAAVAVAFAGPRFQRLQATVFAGNTASMRVLEKCGFSREGLCRRAVLKQGQALDVVQFALLHPAWAP